MDAASTTDQPARTRRRGLLEALRLSLRRRFLGRGKPKAAAEWDRQYRMGRWEYLEGEWELPRLAVLAAVVNRFATSGHGILDLGCGTGALARSVCTKSRPLYLGIDISEEAIRKARETAPPNARFWIGDAEQGLPGEVHARAPFGAIVFGEVLYYLDDPLRVVTAYEALLRSDGVLVYSVWDPKRNRNLLRRLLEGSQLLCDVEVRCGAARPWRIMAHHPRFGGLSRDAVRPSKSPWRRWLGGSECCG